MDPGVWCITGGGFLRILLRTGKKTGTLMRNLYNDVDCGMRVAKGGSGPYGRCGGIAVPANRVTGSRP